MYFHFPIVQGKIYTYWCQDMDKYPKMIYKSKLVNHENGGCKIFGDLWREKVTLTFRTKKGGFQMMTAWLIPWSENYVVSWATVESQAWTMPWNSVDGYTLWIRLIRARKVHIHSTTDSFLTCLNMRNPWLCFYHKTRFCFRISICEESFCFKFLECSFKK